MKRFYKIYIVWIFFLTFLSGALNVLGILALGDSISHFTGNLSKMAIQIQGGDISQALHLFSLLCSYFIGCVLSGLFIREREFSLRRRYGASLLAMSLCLLTSYFFMRESRFFIYSLSLILGLQNALFISYKGILVRTTHITGNLTDAGVFLGRLLRGESHDKAKMYFYFLNISAFFVGALMGTSLFFLQGRTAFLSLAFLYACEAASYFFLRLMYYKRKHIEQTLPDSK